MKEGKIRIKGTGRKKDLYLTLWVLPLLCRHDTLILKGKFKKRKKKNKSHQLPNLTLTQLYSCGFYLLVIPIRDIRTYTFLNIFIMCFKKIPTQIAF